MNYSGSYRKLLGNSKAAMLAAIEIYNKPQMTYRDECFTILLINAWELVAKAMLSKQRKSIYRKKVRGQPYKTLKFRVALSKASEFFPESIPYLPVIENLKRLAHYRNSTVHFYNEPGLNAVIYGLAQTCIVNYRDLVHEVFGQDISEEITLNLLPLGFGSPPDPIVFLRKRTSRRSKNDFLNEFVTEIVDSTRDLEARNLDTGRFLTSYNVTLQSVKKISAADIVVGISGSASQTGSETVIERPVDSNARYPFKRDDVLNRIGKNLGGMRFTSYTLDAIIYSSDCKRNKDFIFKSLGGGAMQYSPEFVTFVKRLEKSDIENAIRKYKEHLADSRRKKRSSR